MDNTGLLRFLLLVGFADDVNECEARIGKPVR